MPTKKAAPALTRPAVVVDAKNVTLGETYTDSVTGIKGVAVIVYVHLTGCDQVCLSFLNRDGEQKYHTVDATRLKEVQQVPTPRAGAGPTDMPSRGPRPTRDGVIGSGG